MRESTSMEGQQSVAEVTEDLMWSCPFCELFFLEVWPQIDLVATSSSSNTFSTALLDMKMYLLHVKKEHNRLATQVTTV